MSLIHILIVILVLALIFGGVGNWGGGPYFGTGVYGGGGLGIVLVIVLVLFLLGRL